MSASPRGLFGVRALARTVLVACLVLVGGLWPAGAVTPTAKGVPSSHPTTAKMSKPSAPTGGLGYVSNSLAWRLAGLTLDPRLKGNLYYDVVDVATGQTVAARYAKTPVMPASSYKLITAAVALHLMPATLRFPTKIVLLPDDPHRPTITRVAIVGAGDSLLGSADLTSLMGRVARFVTDQGATTVEINIDDALFPAPSLPTGWLPKYELSEIAPIRALERDERRVTDTSDDVGRWFTTQIRTHGIKAVYGGRVYAPPGAPVVASFAGHSLGQEVQSMLLYSDNDIAEHVARLATIAAGLPPTWANWQRTVRTQLTALSIDTTGMQLYDGSGLSRADFVTPALLITVLKRALDVKNHPELKTILVQPPGDLPLAGYTGTLKARFNDKASKCARGEVRAKTGFLTGVGSLTGLAHGVDGRYRLFTFILNNQPPKSSPVAAHVALDQLAATVVGCTFASWPAQPAQ